MLLESFTKHPSRSTANNMFKSILCGRCGTANDHPLLNIQDLRKLLAGGNATGVQQSSMLGFYGEGGAEEETKHVDCRKLNKRNFCPTSVYRHTYTYIHIHTHTYTYIYDKSYLPPCLPTYIHPCTHARTHCTHACMHTHTYIYIYTHTYTRTHIYT